MNHLVRLAVGAALAVSAGSALAVDSSTISANNFLRIGGATSTDPVIQGLALNPAAGVCASGGTFTVDVYTATNQFMVACTAKNFSNTSYSALSGQNIGFIKESNGGSGNGTGALANHTTLAFLNPAAPNCNAGVPVAATATNVAYTLHANCTGFLAPAQAPQLGIADVEGRLLGYTGSNLTANPLVDVVFGVPVSLPLYRALQAAQGLAATDACNTVPSLTRAQITALYTGNIYDSTVLVSQLTGAALDASAKAIHICRRGNSSGTQAGTAAYFLNQNCTPAASAPQPFFLPDNSNCTAGGCAWPTQTIGASVVDFRGNLVYAGSGSGQVVNCLDYYGAQASDNYAVGVLSTEFPYVGHNYRFVRVDGAIASVEQTMNGNYSFFTSDVLNTANDISYTGIQTAMKNYISQLAGSPNLIIPLQQVDGVCGPVFDNSNPPVQIVAGDGGIMASSTYLVSLGAYPAGIAPPFTFTEARAFPVNTMTKKPTGAINNCQPPVVDAFSPAEAAGGDPRATISTYAP